MPETSVIVLLAESEPWIAVQETLTPGAAAAPRRTNTRRGWGSFAPTVPIC